MSGQWHALGHFNRRKETQYRPVHCFWLVEFSHSRLGVNYQCSDSVMFGLVLLSGSISTGDLVTPKFQANKNPPLAKSPHPVGPSAIC